MNFADKYQIIQRLGNQQKRKFSDVFLVQDKQSGEKRTMKALTKSPANLVLQDRLRQEATFHFSHPQLPAIIDFSESENEIILVLSYREGVPLDQFLKTVRQKDKPRVLFQVLRQFESIFQELKHHQIVHLDLKPSNIIVQEVNDQFNVYLIDFGMAMCTSEKETRSTLFPLGYAAPELLLNRLHLVDQRTDFFALGILLWQSFVGKLPLLHPNPSITTNLQLTHPLPENSQIPAAYFTILHRLSAKHAFRLPPNRLTEFELDAGLKKGMDSRYSDYQTILKDWENALNKRKWFFWHK